MAQAPLIGILALQGGFAAHERILAGLGAAVRLVRVADDLEGLDGLVLPGGESTTIALGIERERLAEPLVELAASGVPMLGTCAGLILLGRDHLGAIDLRAARNAFGRQLHSFEQELDVDGLEGGPVRAVFIRAPVIVDPGPAVEILASVDGRPVAARQGAVTVVAFHPELSGETRLHRDLLERAPVRA